MGDKRKMIEELYNKIDKFCNETDWSKYLTYEHALEEFIKEIVEEETKELEKENTELKEKLKPENCLKLLAKEGYIKFTSEQLTKAKDIIKLAIKGIKKIACEERCDFVNKEFFCDDCAYGKWIAKAEQFLKECK